MPAITDTTAGGPEHAVKALLSEYDALKAEERQRIGARGQLLYATLTAVAGISTVTTTVGQLELLLLLPLAATVLGWAYVTNDHKITAIGRYVRGRLGPRLVGLVDDGSSDIDMFRWEKYHREDPLRPSRKRLQLAVDLAAFCAPSLTALTLLWLLGPHAPTVLIGSAAALAAVLVLATQIIRYADVAGPEQRT
ncbi:hypothetical protein ACWGH8_37970 [Nonomuraea muscovyensis]|uniref:Integral membrane protein n=1 Tax=Nonomuraea muscovyensis TaxID=1124761 RepID=A0A7X0C306_9ACTN|nr:hypothetical protein [Nonomuraea muscovyensis]MBB6347258.1 hypothetical protein [Nonomuraea muscovyensis]MDF2706337.1 integral rane protein [Nonomuraea muscovyensis]